MCFYCYFLLLEIDEDEVMPVTHSLLHGSDLLTLGELNPLQPLNKVSQLLFPTLHELANVAKVLSILQTHQMSLSRPLEQQCYFVKGHLSVRSN